MKVILKRVNEPMQVVDAKHTGLYNIRSQFFDPDVQFDRVIMSQNFCMYADEAGIGKDLPINFYIPTNSPYWPVQAIHGDVVFIRLHPTDMFGDPDVDDVTPEDLDLIDRLLDPAEQKYLQEKMTDNPEQPGLFVT
ncbi:MAG: hypothetical protein LUE27_07420 [Clostridia bacterium]|nr:hypothetical protein [Clostridia bacterium]